MNTPPERALGVFRDDVNRRFDGVDSFLRDMRSDMRLLLGLFVSGFLILAELVAHGFKWF